VHLCSRHKAFRSVEVQDGYPVTALSHSPSGDRFIVGTGSSQPKVYDREGVELMKFVKGDMYLRDLSNTKVRLPCPAPLRGLSINILYSFDDVDDDQLIPFQFSIIVTDVILEYIGCISLLTCLYLLS
jgi:hypothetical protein